MNAPVDPKLLETVSLEDKYTLESGTAFMTGTQALVRLPMLQRNRDLAAGKNTAGFIFRLSRFAARWLRPVAGKGKKTPEGTPCGVSAGRQ